MDTIPGQPKGNDAWSFTISLPAFGYPVTPEIMIFRIPANKQGFFPERGSCRSGLPPAVQEISFNPDILLSANCTTMDISIRFWRNVNHV